VRQNDPQWFDILRWTIFALIDAEALGITSRNIDEMKKSDTLDVQRLLGVVPGNGKALGLDEPWPTTSSRHLETTGNCLRRMWAATASQARPRPQPSLECRRTDVPAAAALNETQG